MDINEFSDLVGENEALSPLMDVINQIMEFDDNLLTHEMANVLSNTIKNLLTAEVLTMSEKELRNSLEARNMTRAMAKEYLNNFRFDIDDIFNTLQPSENKKALLKAIFDPIIELFEHVIETYHSFDIELPMTLEENAQVPTYAHDGDAAADLYAADTVTVPPHSCGNLIRTGVHIALPENWTAYIVPRSSIGAKTPLRLSNSIGVIDSGYRGALGVLYDNISDSEYVINAGDRIAQLIVMPTYRFKAQVVDVLPESDRGEGGYGSTGK